MGGLIRDIFLIPLPFLAVSIAFFVGGVPEGGVFMLLVTLAAIWFIRPRRAEVPPAKPSGDATPLQRGIPEQPPGSGAEPPA